MFAGCSGGSNGESPTQATVQHQTSGQQELQATFIARVRVGEGKEQLLFEARDVESVGPIDEHEGSYNIPLYFSETGIENIRSRLRDAGAFASPGDTLIRVFVDGELVLELGLAPELANSINTGEWIGELVLSFEDPGTAEEARKVITDGG